MNIRTYCMHTLPMHTHTPTHTPHLLLTIEWRMTRSSPPSQYPLRQTHSHRSQCQHYIHTEGRGRVEKARVVRCRAKWHLVEVHESHFNVMRGCKISKIHLFAPTPQKHCNPIVAIQCCHGGSQQSSISQHVHL